MFKRIISILTVLIVIHSDLFGQMPFGHGMDFVTPKTVMYAEKDSCPLYMDIYEPENAVNAPTVIFMFGGGFIGGQRNGFAERAWCTTLSRNGIRAVAIDYRLGLKGMHRIGLKSVAMLRNAISMAVEDLYSASLYLIAHQDELEIDCSRIVLAGSSAGAISVLQGEYELCNGHDIASELPDGFNYAGVISFSGAIFSEDGRIRYRDMDPCPHFMLHGTSDHIVLYKGIRFFNQNFAGTNRIARTFIKKEFPCRIMRFKGNGHEISSIYNTLADECISFIDRYVTGKSECISDAMLSDPAIAPTEWGAGSFGKLYH